MSTQYGAFKLRAWIVTDRDEFGREDGKLVSVVNHPSTMREDAVAQAKKIRELNPDVLIFAEFVTREILE